MRYGVCDLWAGLYKCVCACVRERLLDCGLDMQALCSSRAYLSMCGCVLCVRGRRVCLYEGY